MKRRSTYGLSRKAGKQRTLVKSENRITTGVCAGIAQYFDVDTIIVRIAFIILLICSYGLILIPYGALAIMLPREVDAEKKPIDVAPAAIQSDIYPHVVQASDIKSSASQTQGAGVHAGIAHIPPSSPLQGSAESSPVQIQVAKPVLSEPTHPSETRRSVVAFTLVIALTALFIIVAKVLVSLVSDLSLIGFFPLLFVVVGTTCLVCFSAELSLGMRVLCLILCVELCMACLPFTTGLCPLLVLSHIGGEVWVLLALGIFVALVGILKKRVDVLMVAMGVFAFVLMLLYLEAGVFERMQALLTYSHHNLTSPLFRKYVS